MPNTHSTLTSLFSDIADAIRAKDGSSAAIVADNFPTAISNIPTGSLTKLQLEAPRIIQFTPNGYTYDLTEKIICDCQGNGAFANRLEAFLVDNDTDYSINYITYTYNAPLDSFTRENVFIETILLTDPFANLPSSASLGNKTVKIVNSGNNNYFDSATIYSPVSINYKGYTVSNKTLTVKSSLITISSSINPWTPGVSGVGAGYINKFTVSGGE